MPSVLLIKGVGQVGRVTSRQCQPCSPLPILVNLYWIQSHGRTTESHLCSPPSSDAEVDADADEDGCLVIGSPWDRLDTLFSFILFHMHRILTTLTWALTCFSWQSEWQTDGSNLLNWSGAAGRVWRGLSTPMWGTLRKYIQHLELLNIAGFLLLPSPAVYSYATETLHNVPFQSGK